ncbi:alpha/beta hydrolase-fold protein [Algoriphagus resistens]|uniref:alpha/beta hydrolase-fold protein n=1 Tax=Algoriphagus resistens TaxID=1750590 RepID=UPI000716A809|nr:alpha/beta hydrolase-fold protein [Algoriphagus resistens]
MTILKSVSLWIIAILSLTISNYGFSQTQIIGKTISTKNNTPLPYVNIGIKEKNVGTISKEDGSFIIDIPIVNQDDTLTFSIAGYREAYLSVKDLVTEKNAIIKLAEKTTQLDEVIITGRKMVEKKYGIKRRGAIHFTDGMFKKDDIFEIGQVINLGNTVAKINSLNLHINSFRSDSADFRINFYRFDVDENVPKERIIEKSILQRHPVKEGWLTFDLSDHNILIKGDVLVSLEFIPETEKEVNQIVYEVKLGGSSKSFFRKTSLGQWMRPPHHYCLYVTALTDKNAPDEPDDEETTPTFTLKPEFSEEPISLFVRLPKNYSRNTNQTYPVVYLLDGNVYFDQIANSVDNFTKKKKISNTPIIVGIGYENAYIMDSLRNRDYTYPDAIPADSFKVSGGGDKFYRFIRTGVIKQIDSVYRTDRTNRTIMGHSLGGYFVLYALTRQVTGPPVFKNFVAASPSLYYHNNYLTKELGNFPFSKNNSENIQLYMTIGELEVSENQSNNFKDLSQKLTDKTANIQTEVYSNLEHMGTAIPTFENGILLFMNKKNLIHK